MTRAELNPDQRRAAECLNRPVLVTAGAGSGKTRMLTRRFLNAVLPDAVPDWVPAGTNEVVAITFTEKAAGEIEERVREELLAAGRVAEARSLNDAWISTIHGLCARLLRRHAMDAEVDPLFVVGTEAELGRMREAAFEEAASAAVTSSDNGTALFDAYSYDAIFSACTSVARRLTVAGISATDVELELADDPEELLAEAQGLFSAGSSTHQLPYTGSSADPANHAERCQSALWQCELIDVGSEACLDDLMSILAEYKPLKSLKGIEDVSAELAERRAALLGRIAATLTAPHARAFRGLVGAFADAYGKMKLRAGVLDFDDLQTAALGLLERRQDIAEAYRRSFRAVMIDEFQDTDAMQLRLVEQLSDGDLCTVGDEKQSIYRFRGADVDVYREHRRRMLKEGAHVCELAVNYRSRPELLAFINGVFGSVQYFGGGADEFLPLRSPEHSADSANGEPSAPLVEIAFLDSTGKEAAQARRAEAHLLAGRLRELRDSGTKASDMVVLLRRYSHAHVYAQAIGAQGMTASVVGGSRFFACTEIAVMRALARVIANPYDDLALGVLIASQFAPLSADALVRLRNVGDGRDTRALWDALLEGAASLADTDRESVQRLIRVVESARRRLQSLSLGDVLLFAAEEAGWDLRMLSQGSEGKDAYANVLRFARDASEFEAASGGGMAEFVSHVDASEALGVAQPAMSVADGDSDTVRIMSIHAAKGLEFPVVAVPDLASSSARDNSMVKASLGGGHLRLALRTPSVGGEVRANSAWFTEFAEADKRDDAAEDNRVLYVAFTRAQEHLLLSGSMGLRPKQPPKAKHHLARLARIAGVDIPVSGEFDGVVEIPEAGVACRIRVIDPDDVVGDGGDGDGGQASAKSEGAPATVLPPVREPVPHPTVLRLPERLSYTQLGEFDWCPRLFWVRRVMGAGFTPGGRADGPDPIAFGSALHLALRLADARGVIAHPGGIERVSRQFGLSAEENARLLSAVARYCASDLSAKAWAGENVRREVPFGIPVGNRFMLKGALDLYSRTGDDALVVDYKSGTGGPEEELAAKYRLQSDCYAFAALKDGCSNVEVVFARVESDDGSGGFKTVAHRYSASDAQLIESELVGRYREIESSRFEPRPSAKCSECTVPDTLCDARPAWTRRA